MFIPATAPAARAFVSARPGAALFGRGACDVVGSSFPEELYELYWDSPVEFRAGLEEWDYTYAVMGPYVYVGPRLGVCDHCARALEDIDCVDSMVESAQGMLERMQELAWLEAGLPLIEPGVSCTLCGAGAVAELVLSTRS